MLQPTEHLNKNEEHKYLTSRTQPALILSLLSRIMTVKEVNEVQYVHFSFRVHPRKKNIMPY